MANDYCTNTEIKAAMPDDSADWSTTYDAILTTIATRASRAIDHYTGRHAGAYYVSADETRYFDGNDSYCLPIDELAAAPTSVSVAETGDIDSSADSGGSYTLWSASDYLLKPYNAADQGVPYTELEIDSRNGSKSVWYGFQKAVKIAGKFGFATAIPDDIKQAAIIQSVRWFKRGQQAFQDGAAVPELSQMVYVKQLDPDVKAILSYYLPVRL